MTITPVLWTYDKRKNGTCPIKIRVSVQDGNKNKTRLFPIGVYVLPIEWDAKKCRVKNRVNAQDINFKISQVFTAAEKASLSNSFLEVKEAILEAINPNQDKPGIVHYDPVSFFDKYIQDCKDGRILHKKTKQKLTAGYIKVFETSVKRLRAFIDHSKKKSFEFKDVNEEFYNEFVNYMRNDYVPHESRLKDKKQIETGIKENSIGNTIKRLITVLRLAKKQGYFTGSVDGFYVMNQEVDNIALTEIEVGKIASADLAGKPHLIRERNRFFVAYNFLLRFNDSIYVDKQHIHTEDKRRFFKMTTEKTKAPVFIPIMPMVYEILKADGFKVPPISNQKSNEGLKELGRISGIDEDYTITEIIKGKRVETTYKKYELITTHTTRRSAATNLYLSGMDLNSIRMFGGWKSIKQLMDYIKIDKLENARSKADHPFFTLGS